MLVGALLAQVVDVLQDKERTRYTTDSLIRALNLGVLDLRQRRPDFFIGRFSEPTVQFTAEEEELTVPEVCYPMLVAYVAGWAEMRDDEYTADGRAQSMLNKFANDAGKP
jgi:hypothetical protein